MRMFRIAEAIPLVSALLLLFAPPTALGAVHVVTDCGDTTPGGAPGQLRTLINAAQSGDTILMPACTITLSGAANENFNAEGDLDLATDLTIRGVGAAASIVDGAGIDGVIHVLSGVAVTLRDLTIRNGERGFGGGILNLGTLTLESVIVSDNRAIGGAGGGVFSELGTLTITGSRIGGNVALNGNGGGLVVADGAATLVDVTIAANRAGEGGGGLFLGGGTTLLDRNTVFGNRAGASGGGVDYQDGTLTIRNSTIAYNISESFGGGLNSSGFPGGTTVVNSTIVGNADTSGGGAGGITKGLGLLVVRNTIVAGNAAGPAGVADVDPAALDAGSSDNFLGGDPRLGPLQDNGGLTLTMAPLPGSPVVDAGNTGLGTGAGLTSDQRGLSRVVNAIDIGAVEVQPPGPAPGAVILLPSGSFAAGDVFDLVLVLRIPGRAIIGAQARFDGFDALAPLVACLVPAAALPTGELIFTCPGIPAGILGLGSHSLVVALALDDGTTVSSTATIEIVP